MGYNVSLRLGLILVICNFLIPCQALAKVQKAKTIKQPVPQSITGTIKNFDGKQANIISVYDVNGKELQSYKINIPGDFKFNLPAGNYSLSLNVFNEIQPNHIEIKDKDFSIGEITSTEQKQPDNISKPLMSFGLGALGGLLSGLLGALIVFGVKKRGYKKQSKPFIVLSVREFYDSVKGFIEGKENLEDIKRKGEDLKNSLTRAWVIYDKSAVGSPEEANILKEYEKAFKIVINYISDESLSEEQRREQLGGFENFSKNDCPVDFKFAMRVFRQILDSR